MKLICISCNLEISKQVSELKDLNLLDKNDGHGYIPEGFYIVDDGITYLVGLKGFIIINIKDLINSNHHPDQSRLSGCCGYDGCDGMNRICLNNHEIGTERSDCWMPHFVAFNPELVQLI